MAKSLRDEVELMAGAYALASVTKVSPVKVADYLREILDRHPIDPEWETGYAQALEFAQYVEDHAKGAMIEAAMAVANPSVVSRFGITEFLTRAIAASPQPPAMTREDAEKARMWDWCAKHSCFPYRDYEAWCGNDWAVDAPSGTVYGPNPEAAAAMAIDAAMKATEVTK